METLASAAFEEHKRRLIRVWGTLENGNLLNYFGKPMSV